MLALVQDSLRLSETMPTHFKERFARFWNTDAAWVGAILSGLFLFFFRSPWAFQVNWQNDDGCYIKYTALLSGIDPIGACHSMNYHPPGVALAWLPAGLLAQIGSLLTEDRGLFWLVPLAALISFCWFSVGLWATIQLLKPHTAIPRRWALAVVLLSPLLFYVIHWPLMAHSVEFAVSSLLMLTLAQRRLGISIALAVYLTLVRFNDAPAMLLPLGLLLEQSEKRIKLTPRQWGLVGGSIALVFAAVAWLAFIYGYGGYKMQGLLAALTWENAGNYLWSSRFGVLWHSPLWLSITILSTVLFKRLGWISRLGLPWIWANVLVCITWESWGASFGYRSTIGTFPMALWICLDLLKAFPKTKRAAALACAANAIWMAWSIFAYRTSDPFRSEVIVDAVTTRSRDLGVPDFFPKLASGFVDLKTWMTLARDNILQGTPVLDIFFSTHRAEDKFVEQWIVHPPGIGIIALFSILTISYLWIYFSRKAQRENWKFEWRSPGVVALVSLVFILFFRARWAFSVAAEGDDGCYLRVTAQALGWNQSSLCQSVAQSLYAPGAPWSWLPAGTLGSILARWGGFARSEGAIPLIALFSFSLWGAAVALVRRWTQDSKNLPPGVWWALAMVLSTPTLYYATHKPLMAHSAELLTATLCAWLLWSGRIREGLIAAAAASLVGYNNLPILLLVVGKALDQKLAKPQQDSKSALISGATALLGFVGFGLYFSLVGVGGHTISDFTRAFDLSYLPQFLFGLDFGIVWTAPVWVLAWITGAILFKSLSNLGRAAWIWLTIEATLYVGWGENGGDFGYRYLIGSFAGAMIIAEEALPLFKKAWSHLVFRVTVGLNAIFLTYLLVFYKTVGGTGPHSPSADLLNPHLILKALSAPIEMPEVFERALMQQFPPVSLLLSIPSVANAEAAPFALSGLPVFLLFVATLASAVFVFRGFVKRPTV